MNTKNALIQKLTAMLIVFIMVLSNFSILGGKLISYAIDVVETNNKNVAFTAYFENDDGEKVNEISKDIDSSDLKLKIEITVKNDDGLGGYFDGNISIGDSNFKIQDDEDTSVYLSAGATKVIEIAIEYNNTETLIDEYLSKTSSVVLTGTYRNSEKEYEIEGNTNVKVNWTSSADAQASLRAAVLTNKDYDFNGQTKRLVQIAIGSKLNDNQYPVKNTQLTLQVPDGVEEVQVHKRTTIATNEDAEISDENYSVENNVLTINIENKDDSISWEDGEDLIIVTFKYSAETDESNTTVESISLNSILSLYDGKQLDAHSDVTIDEEKDGIITAEIKQDESEIYKGKIYTGEDRTYNTTTKINVDNVEVADEIELTENTAVYLSSNDDGDEEEKNANISYVKTEINKDKFIEIFGEEGTLTIKDQNGNVIASINNETETNDDGNFVINYYETDDDGNISYYDVTSISVNTSKPINTGILRLNHEKKISDDGYSRDERELLTGIKESISIRGNLSSKIISLLETESSATIDVDVKTVQSSEETTLTLEVTLVADDESKDLYKNPNIKITLPQEMTLISTQYATIYCNGLEVINCNTYQNDNGLYQIEMQLEGEQKNYNTVTEGTTILFKIKTLTEISTESETRTIEMIYTNEYKNVTNSSSVDILIEDNSTYEEETDNEDILENNLTAILSSIEDNSTSNGNESNNLQIAKVLSCGDGEEILQRQIYTYTIVVKNTGSNTLENIKITDHIPDELAYVNYNINLGYQNTYVEDETVEEVEEIIESLAAGESKTITYYILAKKDDSYVGNTVGTQAEATVDNETYYSNIPSNIIAENDLQVWLVTYSNAEKVRDVGGGEKFIVKIKNISGSTLNNIEVKDCLPDELEYLLSFKLTIDEEGYWYEDFEDEEDSESGSYNQATNTVSFSYDTLEPDEEAAALISVSINAKDTENSTFTVANSVSATVNGAEVTSNEVCLTVNSLIDLEIELTSNLTDTYLYEGDEFVYTITITNPSSDYSYYFELIDNLPDGLTAESAVFLLDENSGEENVYTFEDELTLQLHIQPLETLEVNINVRADELEEGVDELEITNYASVSGLFMNSVTSNTLTNIILRSADNSDESGDGSSSGSGKNNGGNSSTYSISGTAWIDENKDRKKRRK